MGINSNYTNWTSSGNSVIATDQDFSPSGYAWQSFNNRIQWVSIGGDNFKWQSLLNTCPALISILSKKCDALGSGKADFVRYNPKGEAKPVRGTDKDWLKLLKQPNFVQSWSTFARQLYFFLGLRGWCYVFPVYAEGFKDQAPEALWLLPPWHVTVIPILDTPPLHQLTPDTRRREVYLTWNGKRYEIKEEDLILINDPCALTIDENTWLPQSRLVGLQYPISNSQVQYETRHMLTKSTGGWGIFSSEAKDGAGTINLTPDEKREVEQNIKDYGSLRSAMPFIVTSTPMKYTPISRNAKELELYQEDAATKQDICDRFNYPYHLLGSAAGKGGSTTFNNMDEAMKYMYTTTAFEADHIAQELNAGFARMYSRNNDGEDANLPQLEITFDHIECMQESEQEAASGEAKAAEAMLLQWEAGIITQNDFRQRLGKEPIPEPQFDLYKPQYDKWLQDNGLAPQPAIKETAQGNLQNIEKQQQSQQKPQP